MQNDERNTTLVVPGIDAVRFTPERVSAECELLQREDREVVFTPWPIPGETAQAVAVFDRAGNFLDFLRLY